MADVPALTAVSPLSDDVELEDILRRSEVPTVVIRKDSNCAAAADADADTDADNDNRLCTPAPMASFEVLSDVEESDMDDVTSLEAQRDVALDSAAAPASSESRVNSHTDDFVSDDAGLQANGTVQLPSTEAMDFSEHQNTFDQHIDTLIEKAKGQSESSELAGDVPALVFEDVDANNQTTLSSPECLVNNDNVNNDDVQQMWQWTADQDQGNLLLVHYGQFPGVVILYWEV